MIKKFTIYDNHYFTFWNFSKEKKQILALAILEYMFEDITPNFDPKIDRELYGAWSNLERLLSKNKSQIIKASDSVRSGLRSEPKLTPKSELKSGLKCQGKSGSEYATNNILDFIFNNFIYIQDRELLRGKIKEWCLYKEAKGNPYNSYSLTALLRKIESKLKTYTEEQIINLIDYCLSNGYDGIIWEIIENVEKGNAKKLKTPEWFNQERKDEQISEEEKKELEELMKGIK